MTKARYDAEMTLRAARTQYFEINHFGEKGGYEDAWVDFKLGPIPFPFPNTPSRIRAVKVHDLHHILTGYDTNIIGEFEISSWEIGAGCKDFAMAWFLNLAGMMGGIMFAPRRTYRAFVRGRRTDSLYGKNVDEMLGQTVAEGREMTGLRETDETREPSTLADKALFTAAGIAGAITGTTFMGLGLALLPVGLVASALRARDKKELRTAA